MKNKERQRQLDEQKWYVSEANGESQSGKMDWCFYCDKQFKECCVETQEEREKKSLCAKAYNRMVRANAKRI